MYEKLKKKKTKYFEKNVNCIMYRKFKYKYLMKFLYPTVISLSTTINIDFDAKCIALIFPFSITVFISF
jgi:hypothetical protein